MADPGGFKDCQDGVDIDCFVSFPSIAEVLLVRSFVCLSFSVLITGQGKEAIVALPPLCLSTRISY